MRVFGQPLSCAFLIAALAAPGAARGQGAVASGDREGVITRAATVARHGITWHFDREYPVGSFANGDPWVIGPVRIVGIEPACAEVDGRVVNGSMVDPDPSRMRQGYDSAMFGDKNRERYAYAFNVGRGVSPAHALELDPDRSLVSISSRSDPTAVPTLEHAAVLTVVALAPAPDAFRPPYVKGEKHIGHRAAELDFAVLGRVKPPVEAPGIDVIAASFAGLWLDHFPEWPVRYAHPRANMTDYGRDLAACVGSGALALQWDLPDEQKRMLLIRMVQIGIDTYACVTGGCRYHGLGGHGHGRKFPILLAGAVLHDEKMLGVGREFATVRTGPDASTEYFGEDGQTFYVRETSPGVFNWGFGEYTRAHADLPEWGFSHGSEIENDHAQWDKDPYRRCCTANGWVGEVLATRMMGLQDAWNHPALFDYMDRYMQIDHTDAWHRAWIGWQASMWDAYRANY